MDLPVLVWMLWMNRELTKEEYDDCYRIMQACVPHARVQYSYENAETQRQIIAFLLPVLMMRHRRIPRSKWRDFMTQNGKHWIEQEHDNAPIQMRAARAAIGYHLAYDNNLVGMIMTQGRQREVVTIGLGIKHLATFPPEASVLAYAESFHHKLTPKELSFIEPKLGEEVVLRRLCILLALKQAYLKAVGQPVFDWSRLEFNIPDKKVSGDGMELQGWEFRVWQATINVVRNGDVYEELYQCASAFFRGTPETYFVWHTDRKDLESWVQFVNVDQFMLVAPKLTD
ncbi:hypothetical protein CERSUDRAFT_116477 [Gelatoporia subvermispora B]|uniref:4'-phosphopantetheinyl transferase domain-containing protein n=1 Tax=Ceriporiopsis subvermispora (strain B) TaxID=914234 RepID=M2QSE4_CERS8|nr:hypothetical protein CERSUDRAFT_116477 [Gelatoporia subvermispora B]